jgi:peptide-methionine (S)-S-oxide reductase
MRLCCHSRAQRASLGIVSVICLAVAAACGRTAVSQDRPPGKSDEVSKPENLELATFGGGCFWCTEAVFERVKGVQKVVSGYSGGFLEDPTYQAVCTGQTGHAEVTQITFDPKQISYADLLEVFWKTHDPTTLNQQGPDIGTQYRSVVFYHNKEQKEIAEAYRKQLDESKVFKAPIVTEITQFTKFFPAEKYHQDYYELNRRQRYCVEQIRPKIVKFNRMFKDKMKKDE